MPSSRSIRPIRFDGQVVLVTGAGRGLGRAYALLFAERGASILVHDAGVERDGSGGDPSVAGTVVAEIEARGGVAAPSVEELSDAESCETVVDAALSRFGRLDVLVHNAGVVVFAPIEETDRFSWERMLRANVAAPFWLSRAAWPTMLRQRYGRILLTVSGVAMSVDRAANDLTAYSVGKASQFGLMNALAVEGAPHGILVNAISPVASTRMSREPARPGELTPEQVAPAAVFLSSSRCSRSGLVVRAAGGRFSVGAYHYSEEADLGVEPAQPETFEELLPTLLASRELR